MRCVVRLALSITMANGAPSAAQDRAPLPDRLVAARSVYLVNDSGDLTAFDEFYQELKKWNRFTVATSREDAEIIMALTSNPGYAVSVVTGTVVPGGSVVGTAVVTAMPPASGVQEEGPELRRTPSHAEREGWGGRTPLRPLPPSSTADSTAHRSYWK